MDFMSMCRYLLFDLSFGAIILKIASIIAAFLFFLLTLMIYDNTFNYNSDSIIENFNNKVNNTITNNFINDTIAINQSSVVPFTPKWNSPPLQHQHDIQFLNHLIICIGVQKSGTTSLRYVLESNHINTAQEVHYFDECDMSSFESALDFLYKRKRGNIGYISYLRPRLRRHRTKEQYMFEKTPAYIVYPHIAYIIANDLVKYGTKIIVFLRNPLNRFISGYFNTKDMLWNQKRLHWNVTMDEYLDFVYDSNEKDVYTIGQYRTHLELLYYKSKSLNVDEEMVHLYQELVYENVANFSSTKRSIFNEFEFYAIWLRSCYAPQILTYLYYIEQMNRDSKYRHPMKIIQSEQYFDNETFHDVMNYVFCYIHYNSDDDNYDEWMRDCYAKDRYNTNNLTQIHKNAQKREFLTTKEQMEKISDSFSICNKWLKVIIERKKFDNIVLNDMNWRLW